MHILVVHQYYLLPGRSGGSRYNEFARMWCEAGHQVTVLAGTVDHATGETPAHYVGRVWTRERDGAVDVIRCAVPRTYSSGYRGRMLGFAGYALSSALAATAVRDVDVVIATSPPLTAAVSGFLAANARLRRVPWVFEVRDLWPESAVTTGVLSPESALTRALYLVEKGAYRTASKVNVLTPAFREDIVARGLLGEKDIVFIPNGADVAMFQPGARNNDVRAQFDWGDRTVVLYAGAHGRANALQQLIGAAGRLRDRPDILIATVGDGPERKALEAAAASQGLGNITFLGPQPKERMPAFVNAADIGAAVLQDNRTFRTVYPNKVFDYMACERPTLLAIDGAARKLVCDEARAGLFAQPENEADVAAKILQLVDDPALRADLGRAGRAWVLANVTRESLAKRYLNVLESLVAERKRH